ncbi:Retinoblastoma-binding protein, partial [Coemansia sp. BCRC 34490]
MQGHWIDKCPTLSQPNDGTGRPSGHRIKRTTGIPRSFLQKVDNLDDVGNALVTSDGTLVVATANKAAWDNAQRLTGSTIPTDDAVDASQVPDVLKCYICRNLARDAVTTPCCKTVFCSACIESALLQPGDMRFTCPDCNTKDVVPDQLETASEVRGKVDEFLREYSAKRRQETHDADNKGSDTAAVAGEGKSAAGDVAASQATTATTQQKSNGSSAPVFRPPVQMQPRPRAPQNMGMMPPHGMMMGSGFPGMPMTMPMGMPPFMMPQYHPHSGMMLGAGAPWGAAMPPPPPQQVQQIQQVQPPNSEGMSAAKSPSSRSPSPSRSRNTRRSSRSPMRVDSRRRSHVDDIGLSPADDEPIPEEPGLPRSGNGSNGNTNGHDSGRGDGRSRSRHGERRPRESRSRASSDRDGRSSTRRRQHTSTDRGRDDADN